MILQALNECYQKLLADLSSGVPTLNYSSAPVSFAFELARDGRLRAVYPKYIMDGRKKITARMIVPEQVSRTSGVSPNFMCDHSGYVLGLDGKGKPDRSRQAFEAFCELHERILCDVDDTGAQAMLAFLRSRRAGKVDDPVLAEFSDELLEGGNIVFMLDEVEGYLHDRPAVREAWVAHCRATQSEEIGQCLVTGEMLPIARLHPSIKGVVGAQPTGASIVSFNDTAYCSYGKDQSYNSPVSERAAFAYTAALNHLLSHKKYNTLLGDTTVVYWAEGQAKQEESIFAGLWDMPDEDKGLDPLTTRLLNDTLECMRNGRSIRELQLDPDVRIHILGLAPNASRISVRFYQTEHFGTLLERFMLHYSDMEIVSDPKRADPFPSIWRLLAETAVGRERKNIPSTLISSTMNAILNGTPYPRSLYQAVIIRIKAEKEINRIRAGLIKACLARQTRALNREQEEEFTVALNESNNQQAYLLGRLFAFLEKAQLNAQGGNLSRTIRDTYFSAASSTPATVFPQLLRLVQYHISKADNNVWIDRKIGEVLARIQTPDANSEQNPWGFAASLNLQEQGLFMLGYYQQRQDLYTSRKVLSSKETGEES